MKVLLFTNLFPSVEEPTRALFNLRRFQAVSKFCDVRVVVPVPFRKRYSRLRDLVNPPGGAYQGLRVSYPTNWAVPRVQPQLHAAQMYASVRSHVRRLRRDFPFDGIVAAFGYPDVVVGVRLAEEFSVPLIALVMGSDINDLAQRPVLQPQIRSALKRATAVVALSSALKDKVIALGVPQSSVHVQMNGVDGNEFVVRSREGARRQLGISIDGRLICFVGNLVPEKGPDVLIEAIARTVRSGIKTRIVFIGDGPLKDELEARGRELGIGGAVDLMGRRMPDEIPRWIAASDVLCLPSRREGCPNVVLEALACGRPVVGSNVGGVPELLSDRTGILVPSEDPDALGRALVQALQRTWDPVELRASVPSLTWDDFGRSVHHLLVGAAVSSPNGLLQVG